VWIAHNAAVLDFTVFFEETLNLRLGKSWRDTSDEKVRALVGGLVLRFAWSGRTSTAKEIVSFWREKVKVVSRTVHHEEKRCEDEYRRRDQDEGNGSAHGIEAPLSVVSPHSYRSSRATKNSPS